MKKKLMMAALFSVISGHATPPSAQMPPSAQVCTTCHGVQGISTNPSWPNLAGQHSSYLVKQLHDFKQGSLRNVPLMSAMVTNLSDEDITALANFYAQLSVAKDSTPAKYTSRGEQLYRGGDLDKHITACIACHGPTGRGNGQTGFPVLSGQHALYTIQQLQAFKHKTRRNDFNSIMQDISARMDDDDMLAVAYYLQGLY